MARKSMAEQQRQVLAGLAGAGLEVRDDAGTRAMYAADASLYRVPPLAVVRPRDRDEVAAAVAVAREAGVPVTVRGAGTSVAGNAIGRGVVLDLSRHLHRVLHVDPDARVAVVEPGVIHADLQRRVSAYGLRFGPDPSTHARCTIGGMIGNDACGSRSLAYGRTAHNTVGLELLTAAGDRITTGTAADGPWIRGGEALLARLRQVMGEHLATARTEFGRFQRQVSGYAVQHLLPERFDLTRALVGSEGTLAVVTQATVRLVPDTPHRVLVVLGFADIVAAAEATPAVLAHGPTACEGLDARLVQVLRERRGAGVGPALPPLPRGGAWLFVEVAGDSAAEVLARARLLARTSESLEAQVVEEPAHQARLWRIREDGAGLAGRAPSGRPAWPGWEDAAVPPAQLGAYLARFEELLTEHGLSCAPFGHFGEGCLHVRLDFPLDRDGGTARMREFVEAAAALVGSFGGSLSGEHGDGRARSALLPHMYSPDALTLLSRVKDAFDPTNLLNPGIVVDPAPVTADIRTYGAARRRVPLAFGYPEDGGDLATAVHRCTGVGRCRADNSAADGVMCPSYLATREEKDSTRGRARVLQEVVRGELAWDAPAVHESLDLCLACKGCVSDCPTGVDLATYKAEALYQRYRRRLRPRAHHTLGRLPMWAALAARMPRPANALLQAPGLGALLRRGAGVDPRRTLPRFAAQTFRSVQRQAAHRPDAGLEVLLWADTFSDHFAPEIPHAAVRVLVQAGYAPTVVGRRACCGLTLITTGQLDAAKRTLRRTVAALAPAVRRGVPIVGLEPSCTAVLRDDLPRLLPGDADAAAIAAATRTLAELLSATASYTPPVLSGVEVVAQPHCHHHAVLGWATDAALLARTGATVHRLAGCCGLAGDFGVTPAHYDVSVAIAGQQLLPALDAAPDAVVLADGFSCRTQVTDLRDRPAVHLAQLLDPDRRDSSR